MATRKPAASQEDIAAPEDVPVSEEIVEGGTGEALPNVSQDASETPAAASDPEVAAKPEHSPEGCVELVTVRVLCAVTIGETRYQPNDILEGLPADLAAQHADSVDPSPEAVQHAKGEGGTVHQLEA